MVIKLNHQGDVVTGSTPPQCFSSGNFPGSTQQDESKRERALMSWASPSSLRRWSEGKCALSEPILGPIMAMERKMFKTTGQNNVPEALNQPNIEFNVNPGARTSYKTKPQVTREEIPYTL